MAILFRRRITMDKTILMCLTLDELNVISESLDLLLHRFGTSVQVGKIDIQDVIERIKLLEKENVKTILFGVTYALLDLIAIEKLNLNSTIIFETGGMKGRRKEIIRPELHKILCEGFSVKSIASEYGMCELFSQAYSKADGIFFCPNHMKVIVRDTYDPLSYIGNNKTGGINVIDLANIYSCSFIETEDLGRCFSNNSFELLGRMDNTTTRGCNLMYEF
jgi:hypothetical protein